MAKETIHLHNLDKGIEKKYGNVENFVEDGQENKIEESMASIEEVETKFKSVQENADKDGRSDEDKKKITKSLTGFDVAKNNVRWDGKNVRSARAGQDIPYEKYVNNYDKNRTFPLRSETTDVYKDNGVKKLEIQSQQKDINSDSLENAQIAEELESSLRGKYRAQVNPETFNQQSQTPMESWIEREEQSQRPSPETNEKGPLARAIEQDEILNKGDKKVENMLSESKQPKESLAEELEKQDNQFLNKAFKGMKERVGKLTNSLAEKNPRLKKVFEVVGNGVSGFNRWMNNGSRGEKLAKRILISGAIGALSGGIVMGAALATGRVLASAAAGAGAGILHKKLTVKGLEQRQQDLKGRYHEEVENKQSAEYHVTNPKADTTFSIRDRKEIQALRNKREEGTITDHEKLQLETLEQTRSSVAKSLVNSRNNYRELHQRLLSKNERNNRLVSAGAGLLTGLSFRFGPELWDSLTNHPDVPEQVTTETTTPEPLPELIPKPIPEIVPEPIVPEHIVSGDAFINKGEGITHALARQINASPELQAAFGLDGPANGQELASIARKLGYINEDGSDVRVMMGHGAAYELRIDPKTGEPFVMEYKGGELEGGNYVGGEEVEKHMQGENFEAKARDSYEYIHDGSPQYASSGSERINFSAKEMYPDIDFDKDLNPRIPTADELESRGVKGSNGEELVRNSPKPTHPDAGLRQPGTENTPTGPEKKILLQQQAAGIEVRHTTHGTELHPIKGFQFTGEIEQGDFSNRELKFLERGVGAKGYQTLVSFDATLPAPFAGTHLIQLKNGQYALEKVSFGGSIGDAQTNGEKGIKNLMKAFGMPGRVEHFGETTMPKTNIYESHAFIPLSDEQAKFIRESYATLGRALTNVPR